MHTTRGRGGQSTVEIAVLMAVVVGALLVMQIYMKHGLSGKLKDSTDRIGSQFTPGTATYAVHQSTDVTRADETKATGFSGGNITTETQSRKGTEDPAIGSIINETLWDR